MYYLALGFGGPYDIAIVAVVVLVLFGGARLGQFAKSAGEGIREFKKATVDEAASGRDAEAVKSTTDV